VIYYERGVSAEERRRQVTRELGRWIMIRYGLDGSNNFYAHRAGQAVIAGSMISPSRRRSPRAVR
jgi:hypothetical protein